VSPTPGQVPDRLWAWRVRIDKLRPVKGELLWLALTGSGLTVFFGLALWLNWGTK
jgi:hypothetical protein